jgi:putative FmdB family regulatory protein
MPIYEYFCENCKDTTEQSFKLDEKPETVECPYCGSKAEYRVSAVMIGKMNDPEAKKKALQARSVDAAEKEMKHQYNKFGFKAFGGKKFPGVGKGKLGKRNKKGK